MEFIEIKKDGHSRKFVVIHKVKHESFKNEDERNDYLKGSVWLRRDGDPFIYIVREVEDAKYTDIIDEIVTQ